MPPSRSGYVSLCGRCSGGTGHGSRVEHPRWSRAPDRPIPGQVRTSSRSTCAPHPSGPLEASSASPLRMPPAPSGPSSGNPPELAGHIDTVPAPHRGRPATDQPTITSDRGHHPVKITNRVTALALAGRVRRRQRRMGQSRQRAVTAAYPASGRTEVLRQREAWRPECTRRKG